MTFWLNIENFANDLEHELETLNRSLDVDVIAASFLDICQKVMDVHAPLKTITVKGDGLKPWYDESIHEARVLRRKYERMHSKSKLEVRQMYVAQSRCVGSLLNSNLPASLPTDLPFKEMPQAFCNFFHGKVHRIRSELDNDAEQPDMEEASSPPELNVFLECEPADVKKIIQQSAPKTCMLDPIPTTLLKDPRVLACTLPTITLILNRSIQSGKFPSCLKRALVTPALKKPGLAVNEMKNYRPVSNIHFIGKIMEKVVVQQLNDHITHHHLYDDLQSAYRKGASTETAMLYIKTEAERILDAGDAVLMVLLDLSAAFDTIDHVILIRRLQAEVGLRGAPLAWLASYLEDRTQSVRVGGLLSEPSPLTIGVPQGSVLGPLLFLIYISPLRRIIDDHGIKRHGYADDTQLYCAIKPKSPELLSQQLRRMERCLESVRIWMKKNKLKLNDDKTELLIICSKPELVKNVTIKIGNATIHPSKTARNLGAYLDDHLSMEAQVNNTLRSVYFHLRRIARIRGQLTVASCAKVINATVTSRLDYHNALLLGLPARRVKKLQIAQNNAAHLLTQTPRRDHITPVLARFHWLLVEKRVEFKALTLLFKGVHSNMAPDYLKNMCSIYTPTRALRSANDPLKLCVPRARNSYGSRSVKTLGAKLWNSLPISIRNSCSIHVFKKLLKTHFFPHVFNFIFWSA
jgi:hypothetical protein